MTEREVMILRVINYSSCTNQDWGIYFSADDENEAFVYAAEWLEKEIKDKTGYDADSWVHTNAIYKLKVGT